MRSLHFNCSIWQGSWRNTRQYKTFRTTCAVPYVVAKNLNINLKNLHMCAVLEKLRFGSFMHDLNVTSGNVIPLTALALLTYY